MVEDLATLGLARNDPDLCEANVLAGEGASHWLATLADEPLPYEPSRSRGPIGMGVTDGRVSGVEARFAGPRTAEGISVGSTLDALQEAYGDRLVQTHDSDISQVYALRTAEGDIFFELGVPGDSYFPEDEIWLISVFPAGALDGGNTAYTDSTVDGC